MKRSPFIPVTILFIFSVLFSPLNVLAEETKGETLFLSLRCNKCHTPFKKKQGPTLQTIARIYNDTDALVLFISGTSKPIIEPARAKTMRPRRRQLKKLTESEQKDIANYIMSFK